MRTREAAQGKGNLLAQPCDLIQLRIRVGAQLELNKAGSNHPALNIARRLMPCQHCLDAVCLLFKRYSIRLHCLTPTADVSIL